jgi:hypothetical protein
MQNLNEWSGRTAQGAAGSWRPSQPSHFPAIMASFGPRFLSVGRMIAGFHLRAAAHA